VNHADTVHIDKWLECTKNV